MKVIIKYLKSEHMNSANIYSACTDLVTELMVVNKADNVQTLTGLEV